MVGLWALGAGPRDWCRESSIWVTSLGDSGSSVAFGSLCPSSSELGACPPRCGVGGGGLLGALAEASICEDCVGGDAVVVGGAVGTLSDIVEQVDEVLAVVGLRENGVGKVAGRVG